VCSLRARAKGDTEGRDEALRVNAKRGDAQGKDGVVITSSSSLGRVGRSSSS